MIGSFLNKIRARKAIKALGAKTGNRKGFTLVEVLLVLAVATAIITIGLRIYASVQENTKVTQTLTDVGQIRGAIESLYQGQGSYASLLATDLKTTLPASLISTAGAITDAFNGPIIVGPDKTNTADDSYFIGLSNVDDTACSRLVLTDYGRSLSAVGVTVGSTAPVALAGTTSANLVSLPVLPKNAAAACVGGNVLNSVTFEFH